MKLLSYHIENYGKLHDVDGTFDGNITCVCEKNGFGKSTLASFIKAMFYGLPSYTAKSKNFEDRQHFYPFAGGKFGGNLTFEKGGKQYKIERFFDKKSNKGDEVRVYCNGTPCEDFGEEIGKNLFGLDEESFQKTVFITADEIEIASTHVINERLNGSGGAAEETGFEEAIEALEKAKKNLKAARGNNDRISEKNTQIKELMAQIENLKDMSDGLETEYVERERLCKKISVLEKEEAAVSEQAILLEKWERLDGMTAQAETLKTTLTALAEKYPRGIPKAQERAVLRECARQADVLQGSLKNAEFDVEKKNVLIEMEERFSDGMPTEVTFGAQQEKIGRLTVLTAEIKSLSHRAETEREKELKGKFSVKCPTEEELSQARVAADTYRRKDAEWKALSARLLSPEQAEPVKKRNWRLPLLIVGLALLGIGVGLMFVVQAVGIALSAIGAVVAIAAQVQIRNTEKGAVSSQLHLESAKLQTDMKEAEGKILSFTIPYGYYSEAGATYAFNALEEDVKAFRMMMKEEEETVRQIEEKIKEQESLRSEITVFLQSYGAVEEDMQLGLNRLQADVEKCRSLQVDRDTYTEKRESVLRQTEENKNELSAILKKYDLTEDVGTMDGLTALELDAEAYEKCMQEYTRARAEAAEYKEKNLLTQRPEELGADSTELRRELSTLRKNLADCDKRISETERYVEKLPDLESELEIAKETLTAYKEKHALLVDTIEALQGAEQNLKDKYVAPIKDRFSYYAQAIERVLNEKISMDKDFRIMFERNGENREDRHLSAGERAICALCLRLALIDNMYEAEQPFIVMDDPFVHLDEKHLKDTVNLVKTLSKDRQIVYFCCHESREIS